MRAVVAYGVLAVLLAACGAPVVNPVTGQTERTVMSEADELAQGQKGHQEVLQAYSVLQNPKLQAYVNELGQRLAKASHRGQLTWHFTLLDSPQINAFALPGGYVYVTRGIMAYLESEADLAGVIGHEIGHVTARHGAQRATSAQNAGLGVLAASVLGAVLESRGVAGAGRAAGDLSQTVASGLIASYGRDQELQADTLGAEYLARSQFDPRNMVDVIRVLKAQETFAADQARGQGKAAPAQNNWLASHPSNDHRLQHITQLANQYKGAYQDEGRERYLRAIEGMAFGDSAEQGLTRGRHFYHPPLGFAITAAPGWLVQNEADRLLLVSPQRDAALSLRPAPAQAGKTHEDVIRTLLKPEQARFERLSINGLAATHVTGMRRNAQGQAQALDATVVSGPTGTLFVLQPMAKDAAALQARRAALAQVQASFRALSEADKAAARPWLLRSVAYPAGGFAELARNSPLDNAEQQLRLLNGTYGGAAPKPGARVKVVVVP